MFNSQCSVVNDGVLDALIIFDYCREKNHV